LLLVRGITPELYYGGYDRDAQERLVPRAGLRDCVGVLGHADQIDVNTAQPAVLMAVGVPPDAVAAIVARRRLQPFKDAGELAGFALGGGEGYAHLGVGGKSIFTFSSNARIRLPNGQLSDLRRMVAATVSFGRPDDRTRIDVLRWYDNAWIP